MKTIIIILITLFTINANAFDETIDFNFTTEMYKTKAKYKRAKRRSHRRHGLYQSSCMRTKTIRVRQQKGRDIRRIPEHVDKLLINAPFSLPKGEQL